jgi:hypothetical protein
VLTREALAPVLVEPGRISGVELRAMARPGTSRREDLREGATSAPDLATAGRGVHEWPSARSRVWIECGGMQVLLATTAGADHLGPLVMFVIACHRFGHDVVVAAPASFAAAVQRAGFAHAPFADPVAGLVLTPGSYGPAPRPV